MFILLSFALLLAIVFYHYWCVKWSRNAKLINAIPGPPTQPLFGNALQFAVSMEEMWDLRREMNAKYYPTWRFWTYSMGIVNIRHPDDVEILMSSTKHTHKAFLYKNLRPWLGYGLITSGGSTWQKRRKLLTPAFHFKILQGYFDVFDEEGKYMSECLKKDGDAVVVNIMSFVSYHTLNTICETSMGTSLRDKSELQRSYRKAVHDVGETMTYRLLRPWFYSDTVFNCSPMGHVQRNILRTLHNFTNEIVEERTRYHERRENASENCDDRTDASEVEKDDEISMGRKKKLSMLDLLLITSRDSRQIDDRGIREEVDTFVFAGHDTIAIAISFILMSLAEYKDAQERARAEVKAVLLEHDGKVTMSGLQDMQYLERCVKESMRLHPSVPFVARKVTEELQLKNYLIPVGSEVHVHIYDLHRDPNFWPNPDVFDPDRFLPENIQGRHPYCYIPFSAGPRNCIGQKFAMLQLKTLIAHVLKDFHLEPVDRIKDLRMRTDLVYRPGHPMYLKFIPISN